jgi:hypothetical protein
MSHEWVSASLPGRGKRYNLIMGDTGEWDAVIDVSNVCWSPYLPPAGRRRPLWERLHLIMAAWRALHADDVRFYLVADDFWPARSTTPPSSATSRRAVTW